MNSTKFFLILTLCTLQTTLAVSQTKTSLDEKAIRQIVSDMEKGWNTKSGEAFAAHFAHDHSLVVWNGLYMPQVNRALNGQIHQGLFDGIYKTMYLQMKVDKISFVKHDVAMVHTLRNTRQGEASAPAFPQLLITMLMLKNGGTWEISSFHNLNIEYDEILHKPEPTQEEILACAKQNFPGWYR